MKVDIDPTLREVRGNHEATWNKESRGSWHTIAYLIKNKKRRVICAAFLITLGIVLCSYSFGTKLIQKKMDPFSSQSGTIEIVRLVPADIDCEQGQNVWVNWSIRMANGFSYEIHQNASGTGFSLNFGTINSNLSEVSCIIDTSQPGAYIVYIAVWNATIQITNEITLTIQPNIEITMRYVLLGVVGSVAIVTNFTAVIYWQKKRPANRGQKRVREWELPFEAIKSTEMGHRFDDEIYISSTVLMQITFIEDKSLRILFVEDFKEVKELKEVQRIALNLIANLTSQAILKINQTITISDRSFFCNYLRFEDKNLAVVIISSKSLHQSFISTLKSTIENLLLRPSYSINDLTDLQLKLNHILHLERSHNYKIPIESKIETLQKSETWKVPLDKSEMISSGEMGQIRQDLEDMSLEEILDMIKFIENGKKRLSKSTDDVDEKS